jgi:hypothetical protein
MEQQMLKDFMASANARYTLLTRMSKILQNIVDRIMIFNAAASRMGSRHCLGYSMEQIAAGKHLQ